MAREVTRTEWDARKLGVRCGFAARARVLFAVRIVCCVAWWPFRLQAVCLGHAHKPPERKRAGGFSPGPRNYAARRFERNVRIAFFGFFDAAARLYPAECIVRQAVLAALREMALRFAAERVVTFFNCLLMVSLFSIRLLWSCSHGESNFTQSV